jgi:hypothetical protein
MIFTIKSSNFYGLISNVKSPYLKKSTKLQTALAAFSNLVPLAFQAFYSWFFELATCT